MNLFKKSHSAGFTLIELIVTLAIVAILLSVSIPSFANFLSVGKLNSTTSTFLSAINYARGTAAAQNTIVAVCYGSSTGCKTTWTGSIIVFADNNRNGNFDVADQLLRTDSTSNTTLTSTLSTVISFDGAGFLKSAAKSIVLCDSESNLSGLNLLKSGSASLFSRKANGTTTNVYGTVMTCA